MRTQRRLFAHHPASASQPTTPARQPDTIPVYRVGLVRERGMLTIQLPFRSRGEIARLRQPGLAGAGHGVLPQVQVRRGPQATDHPQALPRLNGPPTAA
jgi:hypothetical protein